MIPGLVLRGLVLLGALLVLGVVNWQIVAKERLRAGGEVVYLELAPVDPRSLMQGDYMALNFALARQITGALSNGSESGRAVVQLDDRRVARFGRLDTGEPLAPNELRFRFRIRSSGVWLGTNAFFFQEGQSERYRMARFGEFHVNNQGDVMLVGLRDAELRPL
jgi:uncharacterized membrane-anchored protein